MSPFHFIRRFQALFGETPHQLRIRSRLDRARGLLACSYRSVTDVCLDVGFTSLGTFSRTFHEIIGETPSAYREGHGPMVPPNCIQMWAMRPRVAVNEEPSANDATQSSSFGEARASSAPLA